MILLLSWVSLESSFEVLEVGGQHLHAMRPCGLGGLDDSSVREDSHTCGLAGSESYSHADDVYNFAVVASVYICSHGHSIVYLIMSTSVSAFGDVGSLVVV